tara:strand:- start:153 stop:560 length:408 start_codon:yes stop_codon:yes gene_type:complete
MAEFKKSWRAEVGLNHVPAYQVSGRPFASGSINATEAIKVEFPYVTRWIYVVNHENSHCKIGYSQLGVEGTNYLRIGPQTGNENTQSTVRLEVKVSEIWLSGSSGVDVMAGLTTVPTSRVSGSTGPSWSGSSGVG